MIPFIDLAAQQKRIRPQIEAAINRVLDHGAYIMGPEIDTLEMQLSAFCGASYTLSCANGTDALALVLMAKNVGPGDAVFVPAFTFAATAEVIAWMGAKIICIDVLKDTFNMDPESLEKGIQKAKEEGFRPVGIIPVDLFGQAADYDEINKIAETHGLWVMADAAQSFGGTYKDRKIGTLAESTSTSFFPAKPLGCYGDGGAVVTSNKELLKVLQSLRIHGQGEDKYQNVRVGMNGRMDTLQAAILIEKLAIFPEEIELRQKVAKRYTEGLQDIVKTPFVRSDCISTWAQYTVKVDPHKRKDIMERLKQEGVPSVVYYPFPIHHLQAYKDSLCATERLPVSEELSHSVLSLPMHPYLTAEVQDHVIKSFRAAVRQ